MRSQWMPAVPKYGPACSTNDAQMGTYGSHIGPNGQTDAQWGTLKRRRGQMKHI